MSNHTPPSTFSPLLSGVDDREGGYGKGLPRSLEDTHTTPHHATPRHITAHFMHKDEEKAEQWSGYSVGWGQNLFSAIQCVCHVHPEDSWAIGWRKDVCMRWNN